MKKYRAIILFLLLEMGLCIGCQQEKPQQKNPIVTSVVSPAPCVPNEQNITNYPSPTLTVSERYDAEELEREQIKEMLMITPTPGPEPYVLYGTEKTVEVGDVVQYGNFVHPFGSGDYGDTSIQWLVLDKKDGKVLVVSLYNLMIGSFFNLETFLEYKEDGTELVWGTSDARRWLNEFFLILAFSPEEESCIADTIVQTSDNMLYGTDGGSDTTDKVFLLSVDEAKKYFPSDAERRTQIFPDVVVKGEGIYAPYEHRPNTTDYYGWWLRSPGETEEHAVFVSQFGEIMEDGQFVDSSKMSYRPAMWIDLEKVKENVLRQETE